jgi:hypothetical protein
MIHRKPCRRGAALVESSIVLSLLLMVCLGLIIGGLGVFRFQEVASLAREAARYASVHGDKYSFVTGNEPATPEDVYNEAILPRLMLLQPEYLTYSVTWNPDKKQDSTVTVTVTYHWVSEAFFGGINLTSTSTFPMAY